MDRIFATELSQTFSFAKNLDGRYVITSDVLSEMLNNAARIDNGPAEMHNLSYYLNTYCLPEFQKISQNLGLYSTIISDLARYKVTIGTLEFTREQGKDEENKNKLINELSLSDIQKIAISALKQDSVSSVSEFMKKHFTHASFASDKTKSRIDFISPDDKKVFAFNKVNDNNFTLTYKAPVYALMKGTNQYLYLSNKGKILTYNRPQTLQYTDDTPPLPFITVQKQRIMIKPMITITATNAVNIDPVTQRIKVTQKFSATAHNKDIQYTGTKYTAITETNTTSTAKEAPIKINRLSALIKLLTTPIRNRISNKSKIPAPAATTHNNSFYAFLSKKIKKIANAIRETTRSNRSNKPKDT